MKSLDDLPAGVVTDASANADLRKNGKAFCMAPWVNLSIAVGGAAKPCCEIKGDFGDVKEQSIDDIWHGQAFDALRDKLLRDQRDDRCWKCYDTESTGGYSLRRQFNALHLGQTAAALAPALPTTLDIRFSNLCNFSCRMCSHAASSKWFSDARQLGWNVGPNALINSFASAAAGGEILRPLLVGIESIYFAGGEPLLSDQHYALLNELIALGRTDVVLVYNSNMSELRLGRQDVLALWAQFPKIHIEVSVDGTGARGELIREGMSWADFVANLAAVRRFCPHVRMQFGITVSLFNVWALPELYRELLALNAAGEDDFHFHVLQEPGYYSIQLLPRRSKREVKRRLEAAIAATTNNAVQTQYRHIADHLVAADSSYLIWKFRDVTLKLDALRRTSTTAICPELAPLLRRNSLRRLHYFIGTRMLRASRRIRARVKNYVDRYYTRAIR